MFSANADPTKLAFNCKFYRKLFCSLYNRLFFAGLW